MRKITFIYFAFVCSFSFLVKAQGNRDVFELNRQLGRGINIGNTFEAPSEHAWGNPWDPGYMKVIADLGFSHVRLPVRWEPDDRTIRT